MATASSHNSFGNWITLVCFSAVAGVGLSSPIHAQESTQLKRLDIGTGIVTGLGGGDRDQKWGPSLTVQFTQKAMTRGSQSLLVAFNAALHLTDDMADDCTVRQPNLTCIEDFPSARTFGLLAGVERQLNNVSVRFLVGPALYRPFHNLHALWGLQSRADFTVPVQARVAFVVWGQAGVMPLKNLPAAVPVLYGIGMRVQ